MADTAWVAQFQIMSRSQTVRLETDREPIENSKSTVQLHLDYLAVQACFNPMICLKLLILTKDGAGWRLIAKKGPNADRGFHAPI